MESMILDNCTSFKFLRVRDLTTEEFIINTLIWNKDLKFKCVQIFFWISAITGLERVWTHVFRKPISCPRLFLDLLVMMVLYVCRSMHQRRTWVFAATWVTGSDQHVNILTLFFTLRFQTPINLTINLFSEIGNMFAELLLQINFL